MDASTDAAIEASMNETSSESGTGFEDEPPNLVASDSEGEGVRLSCSKFVMLLRWRLMTCFGRRTKIVT